MEILDKWRAHKDKLEEEKVLNIALRVLEHMEEWEKISPYNIRIGEQVSEDVQLEWNPETKEGEDYLNGVSDVAKAFASEGVSEKWFYFVFLIYYLVAGEIENAQFNRWEMQIQNGTQLKFQAIETGAEYEFTGELLKKIIGYNRPRPIDKREITKYIIEKYPPQYKIVCYSDITKKALELSDMDALLVKYGEGTDNDEKAVVTMEETEKEPYFLIHFDRVPQLYQSEEYCLVKNAISKKYIVSSKEQCCECFLRPANWREFIKCCEDEADDDILKPMEVAEVLEAYFDAYADTKRYLFIYADQGGHGIIAYFNNKLLRRNQVKQWDYKMGELKDEIEYMKLKDEEIDSICMAASDESVGEELIKCIWNLYGNDKTKDIRFTRNDKILSGKRNYLDEMQCQLYRYYDLCFWSKDVWGKDVLHGVMRKGEAEECEFTRQIGQIDGGVLSLVFYYTVDMDNCTFSYVQGKRKAFSISVDTGQYQGKLRVKCMRDVCGRYDIAVYTDKGEKLETG